jgi:3-oxoacyl-[acyl-carrier-protein] synthase III
MKHIFDWRTAPISPTCEVMTGPGIERCGKRTAYAYPASGRGWMALCAKCATRHIDDAGTEPIDTLIAKGETFAHPAPEGKP